MSFKHNILERWIFLLALMVGCSHSLYVRTTSQDMMKCSYGERGSLTATCINATAIFFKATTYRFDQLDETLRCINCTLTTLDSGTFDISGNQIKYLDLRNSEIVQIKNKAFVGLIFLEELNLAENNIQSIFPETFTGVKKIRSINLENNQMTILSDDGFAELALLEKLNLRNNKISTISSKSLNGLNNLKWLDLSYNQLTSIKEIFNHKNITSLEIINLQHNQIISFGDLDCYNITSLKSLDLSHNSISVPEINICMPNVLISLDLSYNRIERLAVSGFNGFHTLENLDLSFNELNEIPLKSLQNLYSLRKMNISHNKLTKFQTGLYSGLPQLRLLNLSHNSIETVEVTGVLSLQNLHTLDFSYNQLGDFDYAALISRLPTISYFELQDNKLPCALEKDMETYFAEDNFKYVLYNNVVGDIKCLDVPLKKRTFKEVADSLISNSQGGSKSAEIWSFVLIGVVFVLIGSLFFLQYRTYQMVRYSSPARSVSRANLVNSELESRDIDYLKE